MLTILMTGVLLAAKIPAPPLHVSADLEPLRERLDVPALAVGVADLDGIGVIGACGVRILGQADRVRVDDRWHLGSLSKSMTALVAGTMVEDRALDWSITLEKAAPTTGTRLPESHRGVTLEQLLAHRSGLPDDRHDLAVYSGLWTQQGTLREVRAWGVPAAFNRPSVGKIGEQMTYANSNYVAAAHVIEAVANSPIEDLMRERIFEPLGMTRAGFGEPFETYEEAQVRGHIRNGDALVPAPKGPMGALPPAMNPSGGVHCSIAELAAYARAHLLGLCEKAGPFQPALIHRLHEDAEGDGYALGWALTTLPDGRRVSLHAGSNGRWFATIWIDPTKERAIVATMNATPKEGLDVYLEIEKYVDSAPWPRQGE
ncbi:MAG: beta-lactamase family protein [Phycisphaerales bacterium]|nr:beta-lactamase family protein [Phycisphaerales bacterium]